MPGQLAETALLHHRDHSVFGHGPQLPCLGAGALAAPDRAWPSYAEELLDFVVLCRNGAGEQVAHGHGAVLHFIVIEEHDDLAAPASLKDCVQGMAHCLHEPLIKRNCLGHTVLGALPP
jgi:hypothetical protein